MSSTEAIEEERAKQVAKDTIPGGSNRERILDIAESVEVVHEAIVEDLNNWVEIVEVRNLGGKRIAVPCRYRWTIKRWADNEMDMWLLKNGWDRIAHRKADSHEHEDYEMEARYRKEFDGWYVYVNIWVPFTEDVFEALEKNKSSMPYMSPSEKRERDMKILGKKRSE